MIHPTNKYKQIWDAFVLVMTSVVAVEIPLRIAMDLPFRGGLLFLDVFISSVFVVDLILTFFSAIYVNGTLINDPKNVAKRYLKGWFIIDLLAVLPLDLIFGTFMINVRLLRLLRLGHVATFMQKVANANVVNASLLRMLFLAFWVSLFAHWAACGWIAVGAGNITDEWKTTESLLYLRSLYWAVTTLVTIGYGDITPVTPKQTIFAIIVELLGAGLYGYVIAIFASLVAKLDVARTHFTEKIEKMNTFMRFRKIPSDLQDRIRSYYEYLWTTRRGYDEGQVLTDLPDSLKIQVSLHLCSGMIEKVPIFSGAGEDLIKQIVTKLRPGIFTPGDYIFREGEVGDSMYFISRGSVEVVSKDGKTAYATLSQGNFFGEIALLLQQPRNASIRALDYVDLYTLGHGDLQDVLQKFPAFMDHIHDLAKKRQEQISKP